MRRVGVAALILSTACSSTYSRPPTSRATRTCSNPRPAIDTAVGTTFALPAALLGLAGDDASSLILGAALAGAATVFYASAVHGLRDTDRCEAELFAVHNSTVQPLHVADGPVALTCEQRRLDMYSRAVTGADPVQRARLLTQLPSCEERIERERAWALTRMATLDAGAGRCEHVEQFAREIRSLDVALHDVVLMGDVEVKHCLSRRGL